jgi:drug/metabolite transporter (DMT)-like permease
MHHWVAVLVGFGGVVIVAQPSTRGFSYLVLYPLASALCGAVRDLVTRRMGSHDTAQSMMFYSMLGLIFASVVAVRGDVVAVTTRDLLLITAASVAYLVGLYCVIEAVRAAEASTVAPFKYSNLVWVTAFDVMLWGHVPSWNVFVGAGVIMAAMLYVFRRERAVDRRR